MHFLAPVQAENDVFHLLVEELRHIVLEQKPVRGEGEQELFAPLCRLFLSVIDGFLYDVEIHERLAAEKVRFEDLAVARIFDEEVDGLFGDFQAHELAAGVVGALVGEAVFAAQVAVVTDVQAERLDLVRLDGVRLDLLREQKPLLLQFGEVGLVFLALFGGDGGSIHLFSQLFAQDERAFFVAFVQRRAARIEYVIIVFEIENVNHRKKPLHTFLFWAEGTRDFHLLAMAKTSIPQSP